MSHFMLIHGAWCGGWIWERVQVHLENQGHTVSCPTLSGLGERSARVNPETGLTTHIADVEHALEDVGAQEITLVGHSYAGMVVAGVLAGPQSNRVQRAILIDAFLPLPGQSAFDLLPWLREAMQPLPGKAWATAPLDFTSLGVNDVGDLRWLAEHVTNLPLLTHAEPLPAGADPDWERFSARYLLCTNPLLFADVARNAADRGIQVEEFPGGHMPMVTDPHRLAAAIVGASY